MGGASETEGVPLRKIPELIAQAAGAMLEPLALMASVRDESGAIVDFEWRFINSAGMRDSQTASDGLVGKRLSEVFPLQGRVLVEKYREVVESGEPFIADEFRFDDVLSGDGASSRTICLRASRSGDGVAVTWSDPMSPDSELRFQEADRQLALYRQIVDVAGVGIWVVDATGRSTYVNDALCSILDTSSSALIGSYRSDMVAVHDRSAYAEPSATRRNAIEQEVRFTTPSGEFRWGRVAISALVDTDGEYLGNFALVTDITDEREAADRRREAEDRFAEATENAPIGQALVELDGTFIAVNSAYCSMTGYSRDELIGRTFQSITAKSDVDADARQAAELAAGKIPSYSMDKRYITKNGGEVWVKLFVSIVRDGSGRPTHFIAQAIDIDLQKRAERTAAQALRGLEYRSTHDPLTELPNRAECVQSLQDALLHSRSKNKTAVLFVDVDHFKQVNDGISHLAGDAVLTEVGKRIKHCVGATDLVSRLGGDEFAVVTTEHDSIGELQIVAERIRSAIANVAFNSVTAHLHVTVSIGIAQAREGSTPQTLLSEADLALYRAKEQGRNRWVIADREMLHAAQERLALLDRLHAGVTGDQFHAWYQPVVDLQSRAVVGFEALARWSTEDGVRSAGDFIEVAEDSGLIHSIGASVISESIDRLPHLGPGQLLSVNASPHQLQAPTFGRRVLTALDRAQANPRQLILEITEQALLQSGTASDSNIAMLHRAGVKLYVDDFGVGYSSLAILRDYPIDGIKLDRSFSIDADARSNPRFKLVSGISHLAAHLGLERVAEGIETEEQLDYLVETGWTTGQGYLFGKAAPHPRAHVPAARTPTVSA